MITRDPVVTAEIHYAPGGTGATQEHRVTHTVADGHDKLLLVGLVGWGAGTVAPPEFVALTWKGERIDTHYEFLADKGSGNNRRQVRMGLYPVIAPGSGDGELYVKYVGSIQQPALATLMRSYSGVRGRAPVRAVGTHAIAQTANLQTITVADSDLRDRVIDLAHLTSRTGTVLGVTQTSDGWATGGSSGHEVTGSSSLGACGPASHTWDQQFTAGGVLAFMIASLQAAPERCYAPGGPSPQPHCPPDLDDPPGAGAYAPWFG